MALYPTVAVFDLLVEQGIAPDQAYRLLRDEMAAAGYPKDYPLTVVG